MNDMIGKLFNSRYEVQEKIGTGGTSVVYKGIDRSLGRAVTIKILREEYAGDAEFVRRFQHEAQAVASLSHGNIVSVYDVGKESGLHYIVMEYVEGETLKNYIIRKGALPVKEAVAIMYQILDGIGYAHKHGIIHRDIKSQNILFTNDGRVKVTDFGIAVGLTEMTQTYNRSTNIMGSVHYIAPEQVQGLSVNEKTDVYSAGVVFYEMLTGKLPFTGDTPISVAMKHVQAEVIPPHQLNAAIPIGLSYVVLRAMRKAPEMRYNSTQEMAQNIYEVMGSTGGFPASEVVEPEEKKETSPIKNVRTVEETPEQKSNKKPAARRAKKKKNVGRIIGTSLKWAFILVLLAAIGFAAYSGYNAIQSFFAVEDIVVPNVVGKPVDVASDMISKAGLIPSVTERFDANVPEGQVISQNIAGGQTVKKNRTITITVSDGAKMTVVPVVLGLTKKEAEVALANKNLLYVYADSVNSDEVPAGQILLCEPVTGSSVAENSVVTLTLSLGPQITELVMPDVRGKSLDDAEMILAAKGLVMAIDEAVESFEYGADLICMQSAEPGDIVSVGSVITLAPSTGPGPANRQAKVTYNIPAAAGQTQRYEIRIDMEDTIGVHTVYTGSVVSGGTFQQTISFYNYGTVLIYLDNTLVYSRWVN